MHPAVIERYGADQCRAYLGGTRDTTTAFSAKSVSPPADVVHRLRPPDGLGECHLVAVESEAADLLFVGFQPLVEEIDTGAGSDLDASGLGALLERERRIWRELGEACGRLLAQDLRDRLFGEVLQPARLTGGCFGLSPTRRR